MRLHRFVLIAIAILLAGFALRMALYDYHGLEGDDGFSLSLSRLRVETLVPGLMRLELDIHPPLHFLALKGWAFVAGETLLSLRLMNFLADLLAGALLMRLAGRTLGRRAALASGVLWVSAPLLIYATTLLRMYALEAALVAAGAVCTIEVLKTRRFTWTMALGLCALAVLYTHITGVIAVAAFAATLLAGALVERDSRRALPGFAALVIAGLLYLPFALPILNLYRSGRTLGAEINTSRFNSALEVPGTLLNTLLLNRLSLGILTMLLLLIGSIFIARRWRGKSAPLLVLAWTAIGGMMALAAVANLYKPRYLAPFVPLALALLGGMIVIPVSRPAWQVANRLRTRRFASVLFLLLGLSLSLLAVRADLDRTTRDDWVAAARFIEAHERPGDAIIVIPDWGQEAFRFHYRGASPVTGVFSGIAPDTDISPTLDALSQGHDGIWLVRYQPEVSDPDNRADAWFRERAATGTEVFPAGMQVKYYDLRPQRAELPPDARPLDAQFGVALALRGVYLPITEGSALDSRLHPPSGWVHVVLYWEALQPNTNAVPRVRFTSPYAEVYGEALERDNGVLARNPISTWQPGQIWQVAYDLNLNPQTPPGTYNIEVMVLDPSTGEPLASVGADAGEFWVIAGQYTIR